MKYDAIILGSGVAGLSVAAALAESGKKVLIISKKLSGEATPASAGILDPFLEMKPRHPLFSFCRAAFQNYPSFIRKIEKATGKSVGYQKTGMLYIAMTPAEEKELRKRYRWQKQCGIPLRLLSAKAVLKKHPGVHPELCGGLFYPSLGRVHPRKLVAALTAYVKQRRGQWMKTKNLVSLIVKSGKVSGVQIGKNKLETSIVVNATGAWAGAMKDKSLKISVLPASGQIFLAKGKLKISAIIHSLNGGYVVPWEKAAGGERVYLVGSNVEFRGFNSFVTPQGIQDIRGRNERVLPGLRGCKRIQSWAGLRPYPKRRLPYIGPSKIQGLYWAAGYYRSGILISPYAGKLLAKGIVSGKMPAVLKPFHPGN